MNSPGTMRAAVSAVALMVAGLVVSVSTTAVAASTARTLSSDPGSYHALSPVRILDTRIGNGAPLAPVGGDETLDLTVSGRGGVPASGVSAVVFNLTVVRPVANGYVSAFPAGQSAPVASSVNFAASQTRAHLVIVAPGSAGQVSLRNGSTGNADLLADVLGYYTAGTATAGGDFNPLTPTRILDTRIGLGAPEEQVPAHQVLTVPVVGTGGVPPTGAGMVALNLTATNASTYGYLAASVNGFGTNSSVNFHAGQSDSNLVVVPVSPTGTITVRNASVGPVDVVADVLGYFVDGAPAVAGRSGGVNPTRLLDTRPHSAIPAHGTITLAVAGKDRVPTVGITAATLNLTVSVPSSPGYLSAYPSGTSRPIGSSLNFATSTVANEVITPLGADGAVRIYNGSAAPVQVVVDVSGYVGPIPGPLTWSGRTPIPDATAVARVSCGSSTFCMAFAQDGAYLYDGHTWSGSTSLPQYVGRASCVATRFCMALTTGGAPYQFDGTAWHATSFSGDPFTLTSVSCTSSTFCVAAGSGTGGSLAWVFNGSKWTSTKITGVVSTPTFVSCPSSTFCLAVDNVGDSSRFNGTSWTSLGADGMADTSTVSCVSATFCLAASDNHVARFDGAHWGAPVTLGVQSSLSDGVSTLSCTSTTFCLAATDFGYQLVWNGTTWSPEFEVDPAAINLQNLSCTAPTFCVVVDASGAVVGS